MPAATTWLRFGLSRKLLTLQTVTTGRTGACRCRRNPGLAWPVRHSLIKFSLSAA